MNLFARTLLACFRVSTVFAMALGFSNCRTLENSEAESTIIDQTAFSEADADNDGNLSREELATHLHAEALAEFDLNEDNHISSEEWALAKPSAGAQDPFFLQLDKNGDGKVSREEAVLYITSNERFNASFEELDTNGDSLLDWEEFSANDPASFNFVLFSVRD